MGTFLSISADVARECDVATGDSVPTAVTGQTGELDRIVNWVSRSWVEIQRRYNNWRWMRVGFTFQTAADDDSYAFGDATDDNTSLAIDRFAYWRLSDSNDPPKQFLTSAGVGTQQWLIWAPWDWFKRIYRIGLQSTTTSQPAHVSIDPGNNLILGPIPDAIYTITGDFQRGAQILSANGDTPDMPSNFHDLIMYYAMRKYGVFKSAQEIIDAADEGIRIMMPQLEKDQLPDIPLGEPMA